MGPAIGAEEARVGNALARLGGSRWFVGWVDALGSVLWFGRAVESHWRIPDSTLDGETPSLDRRQDFSPPFCYNSGPL